MGVPVFPEWEKWEMLGGRARARLSGDEEEEPTVPWRDRLSHGRKDSIVRRMRTVERTGNVVIRLLGTFKKILYLQK